MRDGIRDFSLRAAGFDVVALVGRDFERTARRADRLGVPNACTSLGDALSLVGVDAVTIAAPPFAHAPLSIEACDAGRHVICEKPFALDAHEVVGSTETRRGSRPTGQTRFLPPTSSIRRAGVAGLPAYRRRWRRLLLRCR